MRSLKLPRVTRTKLLFSMGLFMGAGLIGVTFRNESRMAHPVVDSILKVAGVNQTIIDLIGYPPTYSTGVSSKISLTPKSAHYLFELKGPKGKLDVEVAAEALSLKELRNHLSILEEKEKCQQIEERIELLRAKRSKTAPEELQLKQCHKRVEQVREDLFSEYYIRDEALLKALKEMKQSSGDFKAQIAEDSLFWKITSYTVRIGKSLTPIDLYRASRTSKREVYADLLQEGLDGVDVSQLTEEELQQLQYQNMRKVYGRGWGVRVASYLVMFMLGAFLLLTNLKKKQLFLDKTALYSESIRIAEGSKAVRDRLGKYVVSELVRGQRTGNEGEFECDLCGQKAVGVLQAAGRYVEKEGRWKYTHLRVVVAGQQLDLLK